MIIGLFANSTSGLGQLSVSGRSLVPYPPTRISAFISAFTLGNKEPLWCFPYGAFQVAFPETWLLHGRAQCERRTNMWPVLGDWVSCLPPTQLTRQPDVSFGVHTPEKFPRAWSFEDSGWVYGKVLN